MRGHRLAEAHASDALLLLRSTAALALQCCRRHEALDFGNLHDALAILLDLAGVQLHRLAHIVLLAEVVQLADFGRTLRAAHLGLQLVGEAGNLPLACTDGHARCVGLTHATEATLMRVAPAREPGDCSCAGSCSAAFFCGDECSGP